MNRYHINPETGNVGVCRAKLQCRFGDMTSDHYDSIESAQSAFEVKVELALENYSTAEKLYQKAVERSMEVEANLKTLQDLATEWEKNGIREISPEVELTWEQIDELHEKVRELHHSERNAYWNLQLAIKKAQPFLNGVELDTPQTVGRHGKKLNRAFDMSFSRKYTLTSEYKKSQESVAEHLAAWSGKLKDSEAKALLGRWDSDPELRAEMTRDEYAVSLFQKHSPFSGDKDFVVVDIETSSIDPVLGEIIEIGITRINSQGEIVYRKGELFDMERADVRDELGTGWVEGHGITAEMIKGKRKYSDPDVQAEFGAHLTDPNVVLVAHNASFERAWFTEHQSGFFQANRTKAGRAFRARAMNNGEDDSVKQKTLDTRMTSSILVHDSPSNTLEAFTQSAGLTYGDDAHRALVDVENTRKALWIHAQRLRDSKVGLRGS